MKREIIPELQNVSDWIMKLAKITVPLLDQLEKETGKPLERPDIVYQSMMQLYLFTHKE